MKGDSSQRRTNGICHFILMISLVAGFRVYSIKCVFIQSLFMLHLFVYIFHRNRFGRDMGTNTHTNSISICMIIDTKFATNKNRKFNFISNLMAAQAHVLLFCAIIFFELAISWSCIDFIGQFTFFATNPHRV